MKLKGNIDYADFIETVKKCEKDVFFHTIEGDNLNLSSSLSQFLFAVVSNNEDIINNGNVECLCKADIERLERFLQ